MARTFRLLATLTTMWALVSRAAAQAPAAEPAPAPAAVEWRSMSAAKVAAPLPPTGPMAADLSSRAAPPRWSDVPLPPPPPGTKPTGAGAATPAVAAGAATGLAPAAAEAAKAPAPLEFTAPPPAGAPGVTAAAAAPAAASEYAAAPSTDPAVQQADPSKEPKVKFAADQTGAMVSVTQDLESDKIRMAWAGAGGTIPAFEANLGAMFMYKDMSKDAGVGAYMSGAGLSGGFRVAMLTLEPPNYETRDTSWSAWRLGAGMDLGAMSVSVNIPVTCYTIAGRRYCSGGLTTASMSSMTLTMSLGFMKAFGSFDSPSDWSGFAIGAEWAPSWQQTTLTMEGGNPQTSSSFNASGFAINFETGSLQSMASKMGKKARMKLRLFLLPPVGEMPLLFTASLGAIWY